MSIEENKIISRRSTEEIWNQGNPDAASDYFAGDFIRHDPSLPEDVRGLEAYKQLVTEFLTAFPDAHFIIDEMIGEGDKIAARYSFSGTHKGTFIGIPPTDKKVLATGIGISRFENGKIHEVWDYFDVLGLLGQLGIIPPMK